MLPALDIARLTLIKLDCEPPNSSPHTTPGPRRPLPCPPPLPTTPNTDQAPGPGLPYRDRTVSTPCPPPARPPGRSWCPVISGPGQPQGAGDRARRGDRAPLLYGRAPPGDRRHRPGSEGEVRLLERPPGVQHLAPPSKTEHQRHQVRKMRHPRTVCWTTLTPTPWIPWRRRPALGSCRQWRTPFSPCSRG